MTLDKHNICDLIYFIESRTAAQRNGLFQLFEFTCLQNINKNTCFHPKRPAFQKLLVKISFNYILTESLIKSFCQLVFFQLAYHRPHDLSLICTVFK